MCVCLSNWRGTDDTPFYTKTQPSLGLSSASEVMVVLERIEKDFSKGVSWIRGLKWVEFCSETEKAVRGEDTVGSSDDIWTKKML